MDNASPRLNEIEKYLSALFASSEIQREEAFTTLCSYFRDEDIAAIHGFLGKRRDAQSLWWLARYLVAIQCREGFEKLLELARDDNEAVREEACLAIQKVSENVQAELWIQLLDLSYEDVLKIAVEQLGKLRQPKAVIPLISKLKQVKNPKMQARIAKALGRLRDPRSLHALERLALHAEQEVSEEALGALSRFASSLDRRLLKYCLGSQNAHVREITFLTLFRLKKEPFEKLAVTALRLEKEESVLIQVLTSIRHIATWPLFETLMDLALHHSSRRVRMMAESAVKRNPSRKVLGWLTQEERHATDDFQEVLLKVLAGYRREPAVFEIMERIFSKASAPKIRLLALENMASLEDRRVSGFLRVVIQSNDEFSFAAAMASSRHWRPEDWPWLGEFLKTDQTGSAVLMTQAVLVYLLRLPRSVVLPAFLKEKLQSLAASSQGPVRYLAVLAAGRFAEGTIHRFFEMACEDSDEALRLAMVREISEMFKEKPERLLEILEQGLRDTQGLKVLEQLVETVVLDEDPVFERILKEVLKLQAAGLPLEHLTFLLKCLAMKKRALFLKILSQGRWADEELFLLLKALNQTDLHHMPGLDLGFMAALYERGSAKCRLELLTFFGNAVSLNPVVERMVFHSQAGEGQPEVKKKLDEVVARWFAGGSGR